MREGPCGQVQVVQGEDLRQKEEQGPRVFQRDQFQENHRGVGDGRTQTHETLLQATYDHACRY